MNRPRHRRRWIRVVLLLVVAGVALWMARGVGRWLVVEDPLERSGAIVVLSGGMPIRAREAAEIYNEKFAPEVWVTNPADPSDELKELGINYFGESFYDQKVLMRLGVPIEAIRVLEPVIFNTEDEVRAIAKTARESGIHRVIVVTSKAHTRRVHTIWRKLVGGDPALVVRCAREDTYDGAHWWRTTTDALDVVREVLGLVNAWTGFPLQHPAR